MSSSPTLRVAFFAVGGIAAAHLRAIARKDGVRVTVLCDLSEAALSDARNILSEHYSADEMAAVRTTTDAMELAVDEGYDCALLSIPNPARMPVVKTLVGRGIPLLMEKPAAHTLEEFEGLLALQRKTGSPVMVSQNYRFTPGARLVSRLIMQGEIGEVEMINGLFLRNHRMAGRLYYGKLPGAIPFRIEMAIHHLDLVISWLGSKPERVVADGFRTPTSWGVGHTGCDVLARFANGARLNYHGNWAAGSSKTGWNGHWTVTGSRGMLTWQGEDRVHLQRNHSDPLRDGGESVEVRAAQGEDSLSAVHTEFFASLRDGRSPESSLEENAAAFHLCLRAASQNVLEDMREASAPDFASESLSVV